MNPADEHLSDEQIDWVVAHEQGEIRGGAPQEPLQEALRHLAGCMECQRTIGLHVNFDRALRELREAGGASAGQDCPPLESLMAVAAGIKADEESETVLDHAAQCDHCGPLLRRALEIFSSVGTVDEDHVVASLRTSRMDWQRDFARRLASSSSQSLAWPSSVQGAIRRIAAGFRYRTRVAYALLAVILVCVGAGVWTVLRSRPIYADRLLREAYTSQRTMELRIPGASYSPYRIERGASRFDRAPALLEAEEVIARRLAEYPTDPDWLEAKGRAELLERNYESAIRTFQRALETRPDSSSLFVDLASAYFEQAEALGHANDYANALEFLGRALASQPEDPIALFNRAIVSERLFLYTQAVDDWEHYLRVDSRGEWAGEARRRLDDLRTKLKKHAEESSEPLLGPSDVAKGIQDVGLRNKMDQRLEEYIDRTLVEWLPEAHPVGARQGTGTSNLQLASRVLAGIADSSHGDRWLTDLLTGATVPTFPEAVRELSEAVRANKTGDTVGAQRHATEADRLFSKAGNAAGALRARVEYVFATHLEQNGEQCVEAAGAISPAIEKRSYKWLQIQFHLEEGTCFGLVGDIGSARQLYLRAAREAEASRYKTAYLRTQDHLAAMDGVAGAFSSSWDRTRLALELFWSGAYPPMRGYNLYYDIYESSRMTNEPYVQVAAWRDGLALSNALSNTVLRAMAHMFMSDAARAVGKPEVAEDELRQAGYLFSISPQTKATRIARIEAETRLAAIEANQNRLREAMVRLGVLESEVSELPDSFLGSMFYATLGDVQARIGEKDQAEVTLRRSIGLSELQLDSLRGDTTRLTWIEKSSTGYRALTQLKIEMGKTDKALELWEWFRAASFRANQAGVKGTRATMGSEETRLGAVASVLSNNLVPDLSKIPTEMPGLTRATVVVYALLPHGLGIWVYDDRGSFFYWNKVSPRSVESLAQTFLRFCSDRGSDLDDFHRAARDLYGVLIEPIENRLAVGRTLIVEADEPLSRISFEALVEGRGQYLAERTAIVNSPGSYYRLGSRRPFPVTSESRALVVAVPFSDVATDMGLSPLPDARREAEMVAHSFRSGQLLIGEEATPDVIRERIADSQVFHFAGHAMTSVRSSGLLLENTVFGASSLRQTALSSVELAVLSGCDTAVGIAGNEPEASTLVSAFTDARVPYVVASRWNVDSAATRRFMESFYASLLSGDDVARAVQRAQSAVRSEPGMAHPYYWAAFGAFGTF